MPETSRAHLLFTVAAAGAVVMVIEVLGSRIIGPFFGVSLFVWTSLISVTMLALAGGYYLGGRLADRVGNENWLYGLLLAAGVFTLAIPVFKGPVLKGFVPLGLRTGSFFSTLILFGPALLLLGCVSPYAVKLAGRDNARLGRTVGSLYALSTLGSVVGTVATGFVLIALVGVDRIFLGAGCLLLVLGCVHFVWIRKKPAFLLLLAAIPIFWSGAKEPIRRVLPDGTVVSLVERVQSLYGDVSVVDYRYGQVHTREMLIDGLIQGGIDVGTGLPIYDYFYLLGSLPRALRPGGSRCLVVGLGAGIVPRWFEDRGVPTDVVDIDPNVVVLARKYFGFRGTGSVHVEDARSFLARRGPAYDYVVLDVFNGDATPAHVLSLEAFRMVRARMNAGGVLAINFVGALGDDAFGTASVVRTLKEVFQRVDLYPTFDPARQSEGNIAIIAHDGSGSRLDAQVLQGQRIHPMVAASLQRFPEWRREVSSRAPAAILTDNYCPVDVRDLRLRENTRRRILQNTHWDILLGGAPSHLPSA